MVHPSARALPQMRQTLMSRNLRARLDAGVETLTRVCHEPPVKGGARTPVWCKYAVCSLRKGQLHIDFQIYGLAPQPEFALVAYLLNP